MTDLPDAPTIDSAAGWRVVAGVHIVTAVTFGSAYAFSAFFPALQAAFNATRAETALVFSISAFAFYSIGLLSGRLSDRISPRVLVLIGVCAMAAGYAFAAFAPSLLALYLFYGIGGGIGIGFSYVPAVGAVQSWFHKHRSRASGIATAGLGLGTLILPWVTSYIVAVWGWRSGFLSLAAIVACIGIPAACLITERLRTVEAPSPRRLFADHQQAKQFVRLYAVLLLSSFSTFIPYVHLVPAARDLGIPPVAGATLIGLIGIGNIFGRFILAGFGDRIGPQRLLSILLLVVAFSFGLWTVANGIVSLAAFALLFGMSYGGCVGLFPAVTADLFGADRIGTVLGALYTAVGLAALLGPTLAGYAYDVTGSYAIPILASGGAAMLAALLTGSPIRR